MSILTTTAKLLAPSRVSTHEDAMDRLIWTAWRAFWVGLGASAVLIAQALLAPPAPAQTVEVTPTIEMPMQVAPTFVHPGQS
jgi:hypothetical protein